MSQPISVSTYRTTAALPEEFKTKLPAIEDLQYEIESIAAAIEERDSLAKQQASMPPDAQPE